MDANYFSNSLLRVAHPLEPKDKYVLIRGQVTVMFYAIRRAESDDFWRGHLLPSMTEPPDSVK